MNKIVKGLAATGIGAALAIGGFAAATFTLSGGGNADATIATATNPTATVSVNDKLWPGHCYPVTVSFKNDNEQPVAIDSISGSIVKQPTILGGGVVQPLSLSDNHQFPVFKPLAWQGASDALNGKVVPAGDSATFTVPSAVCLNPDVVNAYEGKTGTVEVDFTAHVVAGNEYRG